MAPRTLILFVPAALLAFAGASAGQEDVDIYYDAFMIPHVFGETDAAALYGLGYQQVRDHPIGTVDRLWRFSGRFSEIVGPSYLGNDYEVRLWEIPDIVEQDKLALPADILALLEAYVQGVEDGRAWWRDGSSPPSSSLRLKMLMGTTSDPANVAMHVDPLPDYLNQGFHPFQFVPDGKPDSVHPDYVPADVPRYITRVIDRMFDPASAITVDHLLSLGAAYSSSPSLLYRASERRMVPNDLGTGTKSWAISADAAGGKVTTLYDGHTGRDSLTYRPYLVQIHGDQLQVAGECMPGFPTVFIGFNDWLSWTGAGPGTNHGVVQTTWEVTLADSGDPLRFRYGASSGHPKKSYVGRWPVDVGFERLKKESDTLLYFDPVASSDTNLNGLLDPSEVVVSSQVRERFYVPDRNGVGFPNDRYPVVQAGGEVVDGIFTVPLENQVIRFQQHSFTVGGASWEHQIRLGRAKYIDNAPGGEDQVIDILDDALLGYGNNVLFADRTSRFLALYTGKVPVQGPGVRALVDPADYGKIHDGTIVLDGSLPELRWQGFYHWSALPRIGPVQVTGPEAWLATVGTLDLVEVGPPGGPPRFSESDLASFPPEIMRPESTPSYAYVRAHELLMRDSLTSGALAGQHETIAVDKVDMWMYLLWEFFKEARDIKVGELGPQPDVDEFIAFVEAYRHLAEDGLSCDPGVDFVAHPYSLVTVHTTLLRSWYQKEIDRQAAGLTQLQATLGRDPVHPLIAAGPSAFVRPTYDPNIEAMWDALVSAAGLQPGTVPLWQAGSGGEGIQNQDVLVDQWMLEPWVSDPRYGDTQAFVDASLTGCGVHAFQADMGGTAALRWGHVNILCLTPHFVPPARSLLYDANLERIRGSLYTALRPDLIGTLDPGGTNNFLGRLKFPVYESQTARAYPIGGTEHSLFPAAPEIVSPDLHGYDQALYEWEDAPATNYFFFSPHERGAAFLIAAELSPSAGASARFLASLGGTELTQDFLGYQDRFAPTEDFVNGIWNDMQLDEAALSATHVEHIELTYTPDP